MAEGRPDKGKVFKLTDSTGSKKVTIKYQQNYQEFSLKCKNKFGIPESEAIILETVDGYEVDEETIPELEDLSIFVLRLQKASVSNESTAVTVTTLDDCSNANIEDITTGSEEMTGDLNKSGTENIKESVQATVNKREFSPLNICITGSSGNGKSYLINALRDVKDKNDGPFAKSGTTETTCECKDYPHPKYDNIKLWDVPGVGTKKFPKETYLSKINFDRYDFFLICSCSRFEKVDSWLAGEIQKRYKRFYFLRTKVDSDLDSARHDKHDDFNEQDELNIIRDYCKSHLPKNAPCFLISSYYPEKYDFPLLLRRLVEDAPSEQKHALVLGLFLSSKESIERKAQVLGGAIWKTALLSGVGSAISLPSLSFVADIALIVRTANSYRDHFKLTEEEVEMFATHTGLSKDVFRTAADLKHSPSEFTYSGIAEMITAYSSESAGVIAAPTSYRVTEKILKKLLNECKEDALKVFDFVVSRESSID